jgi:class 3 adenylate cyclase/TolB-like protein/Tfp pilus assembly protein PilF
MNRRLAALINADVVGYSRLMSTDEPGTLKSLKAYETGVIEPAVAEHKGRIVKRMGDGYLIEFASVVEAVECALGWQTQATESDQRLKFRIGVHLGDVIAEGEDIYGDGVNIAARLEALSQPGCIALSDDAFRQVRDRLKVEFHDLGEHEIKNIPRPLRVWEWRCPTAIPRRLQNVTLPAMDKPSIVIMPFRNLTGDPEMEYFTDGLRMDIQNALVKVSGLFLIASGSAYAFRGVPSQDAACTLGATYALEGSIRAAGKKVRVTAEVSEAVSGRIILAQQFDHILDDSFDLQDEITGRVLAAINVRLVAGEQAKVWHKTLKDLRALEAFYKGVHAFYQMDRESMQSARQYFERVAEICPDAPVGATWVAMSHWFDIQRGWSDAPERSKELARQWAEVAVAMPDADGQAHSALSYFYLIERRFDEALEAGRQAVANRPSCAYANCFYGNVLHFCGEQDGAIHHVELAMRVQPLHPPFYLHMLALAYRAKGELESAVTTAKRALELSPNDLASRIVLTSAYVGLGRQDMAEETAAEIRRMDPLFSVTQFARAQPYRDADVLESFLSDLRSAGLPN